MKIIKYGNLAEHKKCQQTCQNCGSVFEFYHSEGELRISKPQTYVVIDCPVCKKSSATLITDGEDCDG